MATVEWSNPPRCAEAELAAGAGAPLERLGSMLAKLPGSGSVVGYWQTMRGADGSVEKGYVSGAAPPEVVLWTRIQRVDGANDGGDGSAKLLLLLGMLRAIGRVFA